MLYSLIGIPCLIFRIWLVEFKIANDLKSHRRYMSRTANYVFYLALAFQLKVEFLTLFVFMSWWLWWICLVFDVAWIFKLLSPLKRTKNTPWLIFEAATLHVPMAFLPVWWILHGIENYIPSPDFYNFLITSCIGLSCFLIWDPRMFKYHKPMVGIVILGFIIATIIAGYLFLFVYWPPN